MVLDAYHNSLIKVKSKKIFFFLQIWAYFQALNYLISLQIWQNRKTRRDPFSFFALRKHFIKSLLLSIKFFKNFYFFRYSDRKVNLKHFLHINLYSRIFFLHSSWHFYLFEQTYSKLKKNWQCKKRIS